MIWYKENNNDDIIISTRIRLARNLLRYPFPQAMRAEELKKATEEIKSAITESNFE